jgi:hypothetical protein
MTSRLRTWTKKLKLKIGDGMIRFGAKIAEVHALPHPSLSDSMVKCHVV